MFRLNNLTELRYGFWIGSLLWLPLGIVLSAIVRFPQQLASSTEWISLIFALGSLIIVAPCGLPLALACRRLWCLGYHEAAWASMATLGILTVIATLFAGLLGPVAIAVYATILSLPVWIAVAVLTRVRKATDSRK